MTPKKKDELQKYMDKFAEDAALIGKTMKDVGLVIKETLDAVHGAFNVSRLPYTPVDLVAKEMMGVISGLLDSTPEVKRKRQLKALEQSIQRKRKLSAEDMLKIYVLHKDKHVSFRSIAKQLNVSEWTVRKTFQKVESVLRKVNNDKWLKINYESL